MNGDEMSLPITPIMPTSFDDLPDALRDCIARIAAECHEREANTDEAYYRPERKLEWRQDGQRIVCTVMAEWSRTEPQRLEIQVDCVAFPEPSPPGTVTGRSLTGSIPFGPTLLVLGELATNGIMLGVTPSHCKINVRI